MSASRSNGAEAAGRLRFLLPSLCLATAGEGVFLGGVLPILPGIGARYGVTAGDLFWVNAVFLLAVGVTCPMLSRLGDIYGCRKTVLITLGIAVAGIVVDIVAPNYALFLVGRAMMGFCPALTPLAVGILRDAMPSGSARFGVGAIAGSMTAGQAVGLIAAGYVYMATSSIAWVFATWLVLMVPAFVICYFTLPETSVRAERRLDPTGVVLLAVGLASLFLALAYGPKSSWLSPPILGALLLTLVALAAWVIVERRVSHPLINLRMLGNPRARPYYMASFTWGASLYGAQTAIVTYLATDRHQWGYGFALSVLTIAWVSLPQNVLGFLGAGSLGRLVRAMSGYKGVGVLGSGLMFVGYVGLIFTNNTLWAFLVFFTVIGPGLGIMAAVLSGSVSEACEPTERAISTGMYQTFKNIGGAIASAVGSAVFAGMVIQGSTEASLGAYIVVIGGCAALSAASIAFIAAGRQPVIAPVSAAPAMGPSLAEGSSVNHVE